MEEESVWLFMKVICVLAYVYIAAAGICCLHWLFRQPRRPDTNQTARNASAPAPAKYTAAQTESA